MSVFQDEVWFWGQETLDGGHLSVGYVGNTPLSQRKRKFTFAFAMLKSTQPPVVTVDNIVLQFITRYTCLLYYRPFSAKYQIPPFTP